MRQDVSGRFRPKRCEKITGLFLSFFWFRKRWNEFMLTGEHSITQSGYWQSWVFIFINHFTNGSLERNSSFQWGAALETKGREVSSANNKEKAHVGWAFNRWSNQNTEHWICSSLRRDKGKLFSKTISYYCVFFSFCWSTIRELYVIIGYVNYTFYWRF